MTGKKIIHKVSRGAAMSTYQERCWRASNSLVRGINHRLIFLEPLREPLRYPAKTVRPLADCLVVGRLWGRRRRRVEVDLGFAWQQQLETIVPIALGSVVVDSVALVVLQAVHRMLD
jgi:hypothetical protein